MMFWRWNRAGTTCFLRKGPQTLGIVYLRRLEGGYAWHVGFRKGRVDSPDSYETVESAADAMMDYLGLPRT